MKKIISSVLASSLLSACASIQLEPGASKIIVSPIKPPKSCKYKGQVIGNQGNYFTGGFTSNRNLEEGAMNDIKNKAAKLDANYVHLVVNRAGVTGSLSGSGNGDFVSGSSQQTNVINVGNAYECLPESIGLK